MTSNQDSFDPYCQGIWFTFVLSGEKARTFFEDSFANSDEREKYIDTHYEGNTELFQKIKRDISRLEYDVELDDYTSVKVLFRTDLCPDIWKVALLNNSVQQKIRSYLIDTDISQVIPWTDIYCDMGTRYYNSRYPLLPDNIYSIIYTASLEE